MESQRVRHDWVTFTETELLIGQDFYLTCDRKFNQCGNLKDSGCKLIFVVVQSLNSVGHFATPWTAAHQASLSFTTSWSLPKLMSIESVIALPSSSPPAFSLSWVFFYESALRIRWPKYWSLSISPSNEYSGLISFKIDWFDLSRVFKHHNMKASVLHHAVFFMDQLSHSYVTTGKVIALTIWPFVGKVSHSCILYMKSWLVHSYILFFSYKYLNIP